MSNTAKLRLATIRSTSDAKVPYLQPCTTAHSRNASSASRRSNSGSLTKWYSRPSTSSPRGARVVADTEIAHAAVGLKEEIERLREQVENVE